MELFKCEECGCIDSILMTSTYEGRYLCAEHNPTIGRWHDRFPKRQFNADVDLVINNDQGLTFG